ncbi:MAG: molybdopterin-synthase adenylyltransferase MoeB [Anaerolineae bacterium]|nr:molybdopterin-synthase adenylyltransferase MoeB [Anaerolineales bacterium]MCQ3978310.1 molybdopterin-synthase adenylyltransferase MoeB [Anaerolineae bacterium]
MSYVTSDQLIAKLRKEIKEIDAHELARRMQSDEDLTVIDVRELDEWSQGRIKGSVHIPRGFLELRVEALVPQRDQFIAVTCAGGTRSLLAARDLQELGYTNVVSVAGGFNGWKNAGYPFSKPQILNEDQRHRYSRHTIMPEVGEEGQLQLLGASVLLIGAGGLGSPAAIYLAAAGVGKIGIVDFDVVDTSNLQRQIVHRLEDVDKPKVESAARTIAQLNPDVKVIGHQTQLTSHNALDIISQYDVVINGSDNFPTRYLVNDACVLLGKKLVDGSIFRFEGQVTVYDTANGSPCYRCLYPDPPPPGEVPSCAEGGVLGVLPGIIGSVEAVEAIKLILGIGSPLTGRLLLYDALEAEFREVRVRKNPDCPVCGEHPTVTQLIDYEQFCGIPHAAPVNVNGVGQPVLVS